MRYVWGGLGFLAIALAVIGTVLPIMPTVPFLIVIKISFAEADVAIPPYTEIFSYAEEKLQLVLRTVAACLHETVS